MYVDLRSFEEDKQTGLICGSRKYTYADEWVGDGPLSGGLKPMDPDASPQVGSKPFCVSLITRRRYTPTPLR